MPIVSTAFFSPRQINEATYDTEESDFYSYVRSIQQAVTHEVPPNHLRAMTSHS